MCDTVAIGKHLSYNDVTTIVHPSAVKTVSGHLRCMPRFTASRVLAGISRTDGRTDGGPFQTGLPSRGRRQAGTTLINILIVAFDV